MSLAKSIRWRRGPKIAPTFTRASCSRQSTIRAGTSAHRYPTTDRKIAWEDLADAPSTRRSNSLILWIAMVGSAICGVSYADTIVSGPLADFQSWTSANGNNNGASYWDSSTNSILGPQLQLGDGHRRRFCHSFFFQRAAPETPNHVEVQLTEEADLRAVGGKNESRHDFFSACNLFLGARTTRGTRMELWRYYRE